MHFRILSRSLPKPSLYRFETLIALLQNTHIYSRALNSTPPELSFTPESSAVSLQYPNCTPPKPFSFSQNTHIYSRAFKSIPPELSYNLESFPHRNLTGLLQSTHIYSRALNGIPPELSFTPKSQTVPLQYPHCAPSETPLYFFRTLIFIPELSKVSLQTHTLQNLQSRSSRSLNASLPDSNLIRNLLFAPLVHISLNNYLTYF